jgi:hypothetical protein
MRFFIDCSSLSNSALEGPAAAGSTWVGGLSAANAMVRPAPAARIALATHGLHRPAIDKTMTSSECACLAILRMRVRVNRKRSFVAATDLLSQQPAQNHHPAG